MKNKRVLYVLLPLSFLIWGIVIYKIFATVKGSNEIHISMIDSSTETVNAPFVNDTFSLILNYKDPFAEKEFLNKTRGAVIGTSLTSTNNKSLKWPAVIFGGLVSNKKNKKQLALLKIDGHSYILKKGEATQGLKVVNINNDSICLMYIKSQKYFTKQKL